MKSIRNISLLLLLLVFVLVINLNVITANAAEKPIIFIGDSRTEGMANAIDEKNCKNVVFYAATAQGYNWFSDEVVSKVTKQLKKYPSIDFRIVISLGINDHIGLIDNYVERYNELANGDWAGHEISIVSICPVDEEKMKAHCAYPQTNSDIEESNTYIVENLTSEHLHYLDLYSIMHNGAGLKKTYETVYDGAHYTPDTYVKIWKQIKKLLAVFSPCPLAEEQRVED